jgi:CDGSH-type Zn-finger protein
MSRTPTIECKPDGPYLVKDLADLRAPSGQGLPTKPVMALCRCGGSKTKPFCDGTHRTNGFSGARSADAAADKRESYRTRGIVIHDNRSICAHAGVCTDRLAKVFRYGTEPWIDPSGASIAEIVETIQRCPSGALSYTLEHTEARDQPGAGAAITVTPDGPYAVSGSVALLDQAWGEGASTERYTLCRCGGSKNKPFCDGTHWSIGFKDGAA